MITTSPQLFARQPSRHGNIFMLRAVLPWRDDHSGLALPPLLPHLLLHRAGSLLSLPLTSFASSFVNAVFFALPPSRPTCWLVPTVSFLIECHLRLDLARLDLASGSVHFSDLAYKKEEER
jgi:hypothetical protein